MYVISYTEGGIIDKKYRKEGENYRRNMIPIIKADEIMSGRVRGSEKYAVAIEKHLSWIKESIETSKDGSIRMKIADLAKEMGPEFANRTPMVIYRNLKSILFDKNIIVELGTHKDGNKLLIMKFATKLDKLRGPGLAIEEEDESEKESPEEGKGHEEMILQ